MLDLPVASPKGLLVWRNVSLLWPQNHLLANSCIYLIDSISNWHIGFCPRSLINPSSTFPSLEIFISLDLMLLLNMIESLLINYLVVSLVDARCAWNYTKMTCSVAFGELCSLVRCFDLRKASLLILNLVTAFACYPPLYNACFYHPNYVTWNFTLVVWSVVVLWVATNGATTKPRSSCGRATQGCATRHALVSWFLVMIHCGTTSTCYSHMNFSLVIFPISYRKILM
jgi:hypothetical protein